MLPLAPRRARPEHLAVERVALPDGAETTLYVARHPLASTRLRVVRLTAPLPLAAWCAAHGVGEALVGGFFVRPGGRPLGELRTRGMVRRSEPFLPPFGSDRACLHVEGDRVTLAPRPHLPAAPRGDLLQAGPLLVAAGRPVVVDGEDPEGFSAGRGQFDSDITAGRHPRAAVALDGSGDLLAAACDGRAPGEAGLTLGELARALVARGAVTALNLDGGGSTSLVCDGELANAPREGDGTPIPGGRPVSTALAFVPRA